MNAETKPVVFENRSGFRLFGILDLPAARKRETGVVFLNPGIKNRVGPHRLYVKMARRFVGLGYPVLRFDAHGLGDSEGGGDENEILEDFFGEVEQGKFVGDTAAAMAWMEREVNIRRFVLAGLCGGAITGLLAGVSERRVSGLLGIGIPVILNGSDIDAAAYMPQEELASLRQMYLGRVTRLRAWVRFFTLRSSYRILLKSLFGGKGLGRGPGRGGSWTAKHRECCGDNTNPLFAPALHRLLEDGKRVFLIFGGSDRLYFEFREKYLRRHTEMLKMFEERFTLKIVEEANHLFTFRQWQESLFASAASWLSLFP